jgi:SNF2 family DNA or RNA helicase
MTGLTREQSVLYQRAIDQAFESGLGSTAFERRGRILALLTRLKQICNHPRQYLRDGGALAGRSGKLDRVTELLDEVLSNDDRALVFTQFREMGDLLTDHLAEQLPLTEVPFLHGGTPLAKREEMVDEFQARTAPPILLVSLRAGGTGLNLTGANHVVHYDRWWNPAVEDQARDRAWRIGQTRTVLSHRLVCPGTVDERVEEVVGGKRRIADLVLPKSSSLADLDPDQLRAALGLRPDQLLAEDDI